MQGGGFADTRTVLHDLATDPGQTKPVEDAKIEARFLEGLSAEMARHEAPPELYERFEIEGRAA